MQFFAALLLWPVSAIVQGFCLKILWGWFMVTTFAMQALTIPQALGLALTVSYITHQVESRKAKEGESYGPIELLVGGMLRAVIVLFIGWVYHLFMT